MALPPGLNSGIFGGQLVNTKPDPNFIPTYTGDSEYGSIMNDYYQSEMFDRDAYTNVSPIQPTISLMNPLFGSMGPGQMGQMGNFNDFLKSRYESMLSQMPSKVKRSQEYMDKMDLYGEAYDKMGFGNPQPTLAPGTAALNPIPQDPGDIQKLIGGISPIDGFNPPAPDMSLPIAGPGTLPSMPTPPLSPKPEFPGPQFPGFPDPQKVPGQYNQDDLLQGIEGLFKQYMPQSNQPSLPDLGPLGLFDPGMLKDLAMKTKPQMHTQEGMLSSPSVPASVFSGLQSMGGSNQITPPPPPEAPMTEDTSSSLPGSLGSQGMFTPGRGY
jgi:hypothetical protein